MRKPDPRDSFDLTKAASDNRLVGLWRLMTGYRTRYGVATLSQAVAAVAKASTFLYLRHFVDDILAVGNLSTQAARVAAAFVGLALLEGAFTFLSGTLAAATSEGITRRLRDYLLDHIQRLPFLYHDQTATGELIERCTSDVDALRRFFATEAIGVGRILSLFLVSFAALLSINVRLALVSVAVVPLLILMSLLFFRQASHAYEEMQDQEAVVATALQENLTGVRVVKAFARQEHEKARFDRINWERYLRGRRFMRLHSLYWPISDVLCGAQMVVGVTGGALMSLDGTISVGSYLAYVGLLIWVVWPIRNLGRFIVQMSSGMVSYQRVAEVLREERESLLTGALQNGTRVSGELIFEEVGFTYPSGYRALEGVTFRCAPGQAVGLLGSTGSGKTTLVSLLPRFYDYTEGSITLDGVELREYPKQFLRQQVGIVEQEPFLFSRSVRDNITYGVDREVSAGEIEAAARAAAIHDDIVTFSKGYETLVGERGVMLSGGQKQRLALARTLLRNPRILILDDSTSSVDVETEHMIREALERLMLGRTTLVIAHRVQSVMKADLILVFDRGRVQEMGTHEELLRNRGPYRRIYDLQTRVDLELEKGLDTSRVH